MPTVVRNETDERDALLAYLEAQRGGIRRSVLGLTDEQAARRPTVSALTPAALLRHAAVCERGWIQGTLLGGPHPKDQGFEVQEGETLASLLAEYEEVARRTEEAILGLPDLAVTVSLPPAPWFPPGMKVSARWILLHLIEETARHAGHADIIREAVDGKTAFELVAMERGGPF